MGGHSEGLGWVAGSPRCLAGVWARKVWKGLSSLLDMVHHGLIEGPGSVVPINGHIALMGYRELFYSPSLK